MIMTIKMFETELKNLIAGQMRCRPEDVFFSIEEGPYGESQVTATLQQIFQPKEEPKQETEEKAEEE